MVADKKSAGTVISKVNPIVNRAARLLEQSNAIVNKKVELKLLKKG